AKCFDQCLSAQISGEKAFDLLRVLRASVVDFGFACGSALWLMRFACVRRQKSSKHLCWIDCDEQAFASGQHFAGFVGDFCHVCVTPSANVAFMADHSQCLSQRHWLHVLHVHLLGQGQHVAEFVYLAHGFIKDGGNNSTMSVARRPLVAARQLELAERTPGLSVDKKFEPHAVRIIASAAEAVIEPMFLMFGTVSVKWFVL